MRNPIKFSSLIKMSSDEIFNKAYANISIDAKASPYF